MTTSEALAEWAHRLVPTDDDLALAARSLLDTVAVALAAVDHPVLTYSQELDVAGGWAVAAHVLDFDDLHIESTSHISAVIVPVVLATRGDTAAYLADAGVRAARLTRRGARADLAALEQWLGLVAAESTLVETTGPAVPGGLAIKLFPCCYAMQRPIHAVRVALDGYRADIEAVTVRTAAGTVQPLIHRRPRTGLEGKFSLEYAVAAAVLDDFPSFHSFTDEQVRRPAAAAIMDAVSIILDAGGDGLLDGTCDIELPLRDGTVRRASIDQPPGSPGSPPTTEELHRKVVGCGPLAADCIDGLTWENAASVLGASLGHGQLML